MGLIYCLYNDTKKEFVGDNKLSLLTTDYDVIQWFLRAIEYGGRWYGDKIRCGTHPVEGSDPFNDYTEIKIENDPFTPSEFAGVIVKFTQKLDKVIKQKEWDELNG